jgi:hypothetical protein
MDGPWLLYMLPVCLIDGGLSTGSGHGMVVQLLVDAGADIYVLDGAGRTAGDLAQHVRHA